MERLSRSYQFYSFDCDLVALLSLQASLRQLLLHTLEIGIWALSSAPRGVPMRKNTALWVHEGVALHFSGGSGL